MPRLREIGLQGLDSVHISRTSGSSALPTRFVTLEVLRPLDYHDSRTSGIFRKGPQWHAVYSLSESFH